MKRRKPINKVSKSAKRKSELKADKLWSKYVKLINPEGQYCACGCGRLATNSHHIFPSKIKHLRHDPANGIALNAYCHKFSLDGPHQGPETFRAFLIKRIGGGEYQRLFISSQMQKQRYDPVMNAIGLEVLINREK